jgi:predicted ester cyclase
MSTEQNKATSRRFFEEVWNKGKLDVLDEITDPNFVGHEPVGGDIRGREALKQFIRMYRTAFPDLRFTIEDQVAEGDNLVTRWSTSGTHNGGLMGIAPTGKQTRSTGISVERFSAGKTVEDWTNWDALGLMQQLGVIPALGQPAATRR